MPTLKRNLQNLLLAARKQPGQRQRITLGRGLVIESYVEPKGRLHLAILRALSEPSTHEWSTVMQHFPEPLPDPRPEPSAGRSGAWCYLSAQWTPPKPELGRPQ